MMDGITTNVAPDTRQLVLAPQLVRLTFTVPHTPHTATTNLFI